MAIIDELKAAIRASGQSYNHLETEIGLGRGIISRFVKGQRDVGLETAEKVAEYFGLYLCPTEAELDRTAERIAAMRLEAENAQSRLMKVQESLAVLLRVSEWSETDAAEIDPEILRGKTARLKRPKIPTAVASKAIPPSEEQPLSAPPHPGSTAVESQMPPGSNGQPFGGEPVANKETSARKGRVKQRSKD
jgi:transcriptional regulator with XRE-family HTH domain